MAGTGGPTAFSVQRKDGTTSTYGSTSDALVTATLNSQTVSVSWNLSRVEDSTGNYIDYVYNTRPSTYAFASGAGETTLQQVSYTGHATTPVLPTYAHVTFAYSQLPVAQVRLGYQGGIAFVQTQQLSSVSVSDDTNGVMRLYSLTYQASTSGSNFSQLAQVQECSDGNSTVCFAPTSFTWSAANYTFASDSAQTQSGPTFQNLVGYKIADVDGDGRLDFVWAADQGSSGNCGSNSSIYVGFMDRNSTTQQMTLSLASQSPVCAPIDLNGNDESWYLLDYDGDGRADLMIGGASSTAWAVYASVGRPTTSGGKVFTTATNLLSSGAQKLTTPIMAPSCYTDFTGATVCNNAAGVLADFNGDGLPDFIYPEPNSSASDDFLVRTLVRQANGTFKFSEPYVVTLGDTNDVCPPTVDECIVNFFTNVGAGAHRSAFAADVNGDGRADLTLLITGRTQNNPNLVTQPATKKHLRFDPTLGDGSTVSPSLSKMRPAAQSPPL